MVDLLSLCVHECVFNFRIKGSETKQDDGELFSHQLMDTISNEE